MVNVDLGYVEQRLRSAPVVVIDEETTGLDWKRDKSVGHVLAFGPRPEDSVYLPIRHKGGGNLDPRKVHGAIKAGLKANPKTRLVNHSLSFDLHFLDNEGIHHSMFKNLECTQVNACLIDERQPGFSLAKCCDFMKVQAKKGDELYKYMAGKFGGEPTRPAQMGRFFELAGDDPMAVEYATGDGVSTFQLWEAQQLELDRQELRQAWEIECRVIRVLHRMTTLGVCVDEERLDQVQKVVVKRMHELERKLPKNLNVRAPTQMVKLFTDAGFTNWPVTGKGNPSFPEEWLKTNPVGENVVAVRQLRHLNDSFIVPLKERHIYKGRVHTTFNQTRGEEFGTTTYRLSSNDPNMQQVHKRNALLGSLFRSVFIPEKGKLMGTADYAQIEPCLLAHYGEVKALLDGYLSDPPIDAHSAVARACYGPDFTPYQREGAKRINQALLTGAGRAKIASMVGGDNADKLINDYFAAMPEIPIIQRRAANVLAQRGYVKCLLGHRARLEDSRFAYKALNRLLQVGNAGILKKSMADIDEYYVAQGVDDHVNMLLNIHDDLVTQFDEEMGRPHYKHGLELMQVYGPGREIEVAVPIRVDAKDGKNWAEASYGVEKVKANWEKMGALYKS